MKVADQQRFAVMTEIPCIPCMVDWWPGVEAETQHVTSGGRRDKDAPHQVSYRICPYHHRGVPFAERPYGELRAIRGPSFAKEPEEYERRYGNEFDLIEIQNALNEMVADARKNGSFLTPMEIMDRTLILHRHLVIEGRDRG